ncbi:LytTR family DNA-binding domain-containing protein [Brevundimonas sp.]|uniref:LytTR family DNA-binding domain-containing protein n=1 Tax=Brevundimonas sp. TaxID=1871086 RepID=UPI002488C93A|nr:LytTR family DNA-binding domain-containing protein [Brevundimonas sp.]MDI1280806.1 LytTR family DNA-binding domain-containing protein [Brevundimonas sp.]
MQSMNTTRAWVIDLSGFAAAGVILGVVGPFGTFFNDALPQRVAYWMCLCLISGVVIGAAVRWTWPPARRRGLPAWAWVPAVAVAITVPLGLLSRVIAIGLWPGVRQAVGWTEWYGQALLVELVLLALYVAAHSRAGWLTGPAAPAMVPVEAGAARILDRLPRRLGRDLLCLQMEDHYVRLHTLEGSVLVLMPFTRAIADVGPIDGLRVHRSWWVARQAVRGVIHDGRNLRLRLTSGLEAPVARARIAELKAAGWLAGDV